MRAPVPSSSMRQCSSAGEDGAAGQLGRRRHRHSTRSPCLCGGWRRLAPLALSGSYVKISVSGECPHLCPQSRAVKFFAGGQGTYRDNSGMTATGQIAMSPFPWSSTRDGSTTPLSGIVQITVQGYFHVLRPQVRVVEFFAGETVASGHTGRRQPRQAKDYPVLRG